MNTVYMARRQVYTDEQVLLGPYSSHAAALACAQDSLYPESARVEVVDVATISADYEPISSYPDWAQKEKTTYYGFQESYRLIPPHFAIELSSELADIETFAPECFRLPSREVTESMMVAGLVTGLDRAYLCMHVIWTTNESVITALSLAGYFDRLVRARGYSDRRTLLDLRDDSIKIRDDPYKYEDSEESLPAIIGNKFWNRFVIDHSRPPSFDPEKWDF